MQGHGMRHALRVTGCVVACLNLFLFFFLVVLFLSIFFFIFEVALILELVFLFVVHVDAASNCPASVQ